MDHGQILLQTPRPGLPISGGETPAGLTSELAVEGANMLVRGLRERVFVPPVEDLTPNLSEDDKRRLRLAPKITPEDRHIQWNGWASNEIALRSRVLGNLWNNARVLGEEIRITFSKGLQIAAETSVSADIGPGIPMAVPGSSGTMFFRTIDGEVLGAEYVTVPGYGTKKAADIARKLKIIEPSGAELLKGSQSLR